MMHDRGKSGSAIVRCEAAEQCRATGGGAGGAKGEDQEERR